MTHTTGAADAATTTAQSPARPSRRWRTVDVMVTVAIGIAFGFVFLGLNYLYYPLNAAMTAFPPVGGVLGGLWFLPAVIAGLIIRKPGAAVLAELLAAFVEMIFGGQWGWTTMLSGLVQGGGVEVGFALLAYRRFGIGAAALAGSVAAVFEWVYEAFFTSSAAWSLLWKLIYLVIMVGSGAIVCTLISVLLVRALAATGAINAFGPGREHSRGLEGADTV